jgi:hypothetical protein
MKGLELESQFLQSSDGLFDNFRPNVEKDHHKSANIETQAWPFIKLVFRQNLQCSFPNPSLDSAIFIEKKVMANLPLRKREKLWREKKSHSAVTVVACRACVPASTGRPANRLAALSDGLLSPSRRRQTLLSSRPHTLRSSQDTYILWYDNLMFNKVPV